MTRHVLNLDGQDHATSVPGRSLSHTTYGGYCSSASLGDVEEVFQKADGLLAEASLADDIARYLGREE